MKTKTVPFDQHLYHDIEDDNEALQYKEQAMPLIGAIVLYFNGLEKELDSLICEIFTDRSDSTGLIVLHRMNYSTKVGLFKRFNDDMFANVDFVINEHDELITQLFECGRLRNLVVHADWENTGDDGYTYVRLNIKKDKMSQEYIQFSEDSLLKIIDVIIGARTELHKFWEKRNDKLYAQQSS
jgi:hypothetical protein